MLSSFGSATGSSALVPVAVAPPVKSRLNPSSTRPVPSLSAEQLIDLQSKRSRFIKRGGDIVFSMLVLGLGSPVLLALALLVKLSSKGPVFYVQQRVGRDYRSFGCIKFRTMRRDADKILSRILSESPDLQEEFRNDFKQIGRAHV